MFAALNAFQVGAVPTLVSDVFSTTLYTGNGSSQTISNGINLSSKGGLTWVKSRSSAEYNHLVDTVRGGSNALYSNDLSAQSNSSTYITAFNETGFTLGSSTGMNGSGLSLVSWTFREQAKFFDIVTYTGDGTSNRAIAHNLGSTPGCVIVKSTSNAQNWPVYHRSTGANTIFWLNATNANSANVGYFPTAPDSTSFYVGTDTDVNQSGYTYVAYLFAHNAGGFGLTGSDNIITCDSTNGSKVTLGYQPQWILYKSRDFSEFWQVVDSQRGMPAALPAQLLKPNTSDAETTTSNNITIASDGFTLGAVTGTVIYIAIKAS